MKLTSKIKLLNSLGLFNVTRSLYYGLDTFNADILKFYREFVKEGDLCFDIGANIGRKTDIFLKLGARVVAVEPNPECFKFLEWKYRRRKDVVLIRQAVDTRTDKKEMFICESNSLSSLSADWIRASRESGRCADFHWDKKITVETTTLDNLIDTYGRPEFCKIDVEGYEINVIEGLSRIIPNISLELAPESVAKIRECIRHLARLGTVVCNYSDGETAVRFNLEKWLTPQEMIICLDRGPHRPMYGELYLRFVQ